MGHVDHGKTSLLDTIRGTNVTAKEFGGITQNTRTHQIVTKAGNKITFIDTPGHQAFSAMRSRGAEVTDFVLLVVAADDGIQPQTKESIEFAHAAGTPIIVAINKVDIEGVKIEKVKQQLASFGVNIEEYGGDVMCFQVSATKKQGIEELIEGIELLSEISELKPHEPKYGALAQGYIIESSIDKFLGPIALGILKAGEINDRLVGTTFDQTFKVRAYLDQNQKATSHIEESDPFWITGLKSVLNTGDLVYFAKDEKAAEAVKEQLPTKEIPAEAAEVTAEVDLNDVLFNMLVQKEAEKQGTEQKILNVIVKASTKGTLEAVLAELTKLGDAEKKLRVLYAEPGEVNENDIKRAKDASGVVISFQAPLSNKLQILAKQLRVVVRNYEIIYEMTDELSSALDSLIEPPEIEVEVARARVKQIFTLTDGTTVAGCEVTKGTILKGYQVYVERPSQSTKDAIAEIGRGKITSLRMRKDEVREVKKGSECGIVIDPTVQNMETGDEIVAFKTE